MQACEQDASISPGAFPENVVALLSSVLRIAPTRDGRKQMTRVLTLILRSLTLKLCVGDGIKSTGLRDGINLCETKNTKAEA